MVKRHSRRRTGGCWSFAVVLAMLLCPAVGWAQSTPPSDYCYESQCSSSQAEAEQAMRNDPQLVVHAQNLAYYRTRVLASSNRLELQYRVWNRPAASVSVPVYHGVTGIFDNGNFGCPSPIPGQAFCGDEQTLLQAAINSIAQRIGGEGATCAASGVTLAKDYDSPGLMHPLSGYVTFGHKSYRPVIFSCTRGTEQFTREHYVSIEKRYYLTCDAGFSLTSANVLEENVATARVCVPNGPSQAEITAPIRQVASCNANANPCHPATGDKSREEVDFEFAGRPFVRYYHSLVQLRNDASFGIGWSHTYNDRVDRSAVYRLGEDGTYEAFSLAIGAPVLLTYYGRNSTDTVLISSNSGPIRARLYLPDGDVRGYDIDGRLVEIRNVERPERNVAVTYQNGLMHRVTDESGRQLQFAYVEGRLASIALPDGRLVSYAYDAQQNLTGVDYGDGTGKSYHYAEAGLAPPGFPNHLTGITDETQARYASFDYDAFGRVTGSRLHAGTGDAAEVTLTYNVDGTASIHTENGDERVFAFDATIYKRPLSVSDSGRNVVSTYTPGGRTETRSDGASVTRYHYQPTYLSGLTEAEGTPSERRTTFVRDAEQRLAERRSGGLRNGVWTEFLAQKFVRDASGRVAARCDVDLDVAGADAYACGSLPHAPLGVRQTRYTHCSEADATAGLCPLAGRVLSIDGPRTDVSDVTTYAYRMADAPGCDTAPATCEYRKGDLWKVTSALGHVTETLRQDGAGRPLSVKDPNGVVTDFAYSARGWLTATKVRGTNDASEADDLVTTFEYWPTGLVKKVTQPDGAFISYGYDTAQRLTTITDNAGNTITYTLDNAGNRVQEDTRDPGGTLRRTLSRLYNPLGQLATQADASSNPTDFTYDARGNVKTVTDALQRVASNDYDPLSRLQRTLQDVGGIEAETAFEYDALDQLTKVTDPKGLETTYTYNAFGDLLQLDSPDTGITTYTYDSAGNRTSQADANNVTTTFSYDALDRLVGVGYPDASRNLTYLYDTVINVCPADTNFQQGRLGRLRDASGSTILRYCYDRFGNLTRKHQVTDGKHHIVHYGHTKAGRLAAVTYPDGAVVDYQRDALGRVAEVGVTPATRGREVVVTQVQHHPFGPVAGWRYGGASGRQMVRAYDLDYRPASIRTFATDGLDYGYRYDAVGQLAFLDTADLSQPLARFEHDALGRIEVFRDGASNALIEGYAYDATGNRTAFTDNGGTAAYAYPVDSHRLASVAGVGRTYDAAGNTRTIGAKEFLYDHANRMAEVRQGGVTAMRYAYNGKGERVRRYLGTDDTYSTYDEAGRWMGDYRSSSSIQEASQKIIWLDDLPVAVLWSHIDANGPVEVGPDPDPGPGDPDPPIGARSTGSSVISIVDALHYIEPDHLGTPRAVIDPLRDVAVWSWDLRSEAFGNSPPNQDPDGDGTSFVFDMRFPGQRYDAASGLNYNYFREYEPGTGRYSQSDPIGLSGGINTYVYTLNNPLRAVDPLGLQSRGLVRNWNGAPYTQGAANDDEYDVKPGSTIIPFPSRASEKECPPIDCHIQKTQLMNQRFLIQMREGVENVTGAFLNDLVGRKLAWNRAARAYNSVCSTSRSGPIAEVWFFDLGPLG